MVNCNCPSSLLPKSRVGARTFKRIFEFDVTSISKDSLIGIIDELGDVRAFLRMISVR